MPGRRRTAGRTFSVAQGHAHVDDGSAGARAEPSNSLIVRALARLLRYSSARGWGLLGGFWGAMFWMWGKRQRKDAAFVRPSAAEVEDEYSSYLARIRFPMVRAGIVGVVGVSLIYLLSWLQMISRIMEAPGALVQNSPSLYLAPLPASLTAAGFSLLAAIAIGLQLAVRSPSETEARPVVVLARRRFLCLLAQVVVLASVALAAYVILQELTSGPTVIDVLRLFAPAAGGALVGLIAADAGVAADPDFAPAELGRVSRERAARRLLMGLRLVGGPYSTTQRRAIAIQIVALVVAPVAVVVVSTWGVGVRPL